MGKSLGCICEEIVVELGIVFINERFYMRNGLAHREIYRSELCNLIYRYLLNCDHSEFIDDRSIKGASELIQFISYSSAENLNPSDSYLFQNGILKLDAHTEKIIFLSKEENKSEIQKNIYTFQSDVFYDPAVETSYAIEYLKSIVLEIQHALLLEPAIFGMFPDLTNKVQFDRFGMSFGFGENGKTIFYENVLTAIFGRAAIAHIRIDKLDTRFGLSSLIGKRLNISTENDSYIAESSVIKSLTSGDHQEVEAKYKDAVQMKLFVPSYFCVNAQPILSVNLSYAMKRRLGVINFPYQFSSNPTGNQKQADLSLRSPQSAKVKLIQQSLLNLMVQQAQKIMTEKRLTPIDIKYVEDIQTANWHHLQFAEEFFEFTNNPNDFQLARALSECYEIFCRREGLAKTVGGRVIFETGDVKDKSTPTHSSLSKKLRALFPKLETLKSKEGRGLRGIKIKQPYEKEEYRKFNLELLRKTDSAERSEMQSGFQSSSRPH